MSELFSEVETLIKRAAITLDPLHALQTSQAAMNAASALRVLFDIRRIENHTEGAETK